MSRTVETMLVTRNLPPLQGGMERLMQHTARALVGTGPTGVVGPRGCGAFLPSEIDTWETAFGVPWFHLGAMRVLHAQGWPRLRRVLAGSGLVAPLAESLARRRGVPYGVFVHGLDLVAPYRLYRHGFLPSVRRADVVIANSHATAALARAAGVPGERLEILHPGVETNPPTVGETVFRQQAGLGDARFLLSVGRLTKRKGLEPFIRTAWPVVARAHPDLRLVVVGTEPGRASAEGEVADSLRRAAAESGLAERVLLMGSLADPQLAAAYRAAAGFVFPVLALPGDLEGFGMVAVEAAAQGCPTVGFAVGGVVDAVSPGSGALVPAGDYAALARTLETLLADGLPGVSPASCRAHAERFGWQLHAQRLLAICAKLDA